MRDGEGFYLIGPEWFEGPLGAVLVNANWRDVGMAGICAIRRARGLVYAFCYLVDVFGLGLKDCYPMRPLTEATFKASYIDHRRRSGEELCELHPSLARSLVWGGVHTAQRNGFRPPECYSECCRGVGADRGGGQSSRDCSVRTARYTSSDRGKTSGLG